MPVQSNVPNGNPQNQNFEWNNVIHQFSDWHPSDRQQMAYFRDAH
jgi:hypothetical protein